MIRSGLRREVAITPLKSLWIFLSVGLDSSSFEGEGRAQALGLGQAGEKSSGWRARGEGLSWRQIVFTKEKDAGNLLLPYQSKGDSLLSLMAKLVLSQLPWVPFPRARDSLSLAL